jgi:hypothetical protein
MIGFAVNTDPLSIVERQRTSRPDALLSSSSYCVVPKSSLTRNKMKQPREVPRALTETQADRGIRR